MGRPRLVCKWVPDALEHYTAVLGEASRTDYHHDFPWQAHAERAQDQADTLRAVLTDLIAEIRANWTAPSDRPDCGCDGCGVARVLDRAEQRLREVQGE